MNKHLNIFTTYAKENRRYQLENDLTRAFAICLQEDTLFSHEVLKTIFGESNFYNQLFEDPNGCADMHVEIQKATSDITGFEHLFAVSLSESEMSDFCAQSHNRQYDPICDVVISIDNIAIVVEAKRDNVDCTAQLYNQIFNIYKEQGRSLAECHDEVSPVDLNWPKLMNIAVKVNRFQKTTGNNNRFLADFIELVKGHNFRWLPEPPLGSLSPSNKDAIHRRVESALNQFCKYEENAGRLENKSRLGCRFSESWADELLFKVDSDSGDLIASIYPGNTKKQGVPLFRRTPVFSETLLVNGVSYPVHKQYNIAFRGQQNICGVRFHDKHLRKPLYTKANFDTYVGRNKRHQWTRVEDLLDEYLNFDWKAQCNWTKRIEGSNRSQFDMSFGYEFQIRIPFDTLSALDQTQKEIIPLANLIREIYQAFKTNLIKAPSK